ncbi:hypothetical protein [Pseudomonas sp. B22129]|uniref:hypothetical protein n=1 Tax=Pseudomonas sp. B22129 TaxID=3235111 RepID=UPI003783E1B8
MTSVNTRPQTPYMTGYEQPRNSVPAGQENNPEASGSAGPQTYSEPPRGPMTPEQRGQFSSHSGMINPQPPQGADMSAELAEVAQKNQNLLGKYATLATKIQTKLPELATKIGTLEQQIHSSRQQTEGTSGAQGSKLQNRFADAQTVATEPPETSDTPDTQTTEQVHAAGFAQLTEDISQLKNALGVLMQNLKNAMTVLTDKLDELTQLLSQSAPQNQNHPLSAGTTEAALPNDMAPEMMTPSQAKKPALTNESTESAPGTIEYFKQENQKLEIQIDEMTAYFEQMMSTLEEQIKTLTRQIEAQAK